MTTTRGHTPRRPGRPVPLAPLVLPALVLPLVAGCAQTEAPTVDTSPIAVPSTGSSGATGSPPPTPDVPSATVTTVDPRSPEEVLEAAVAAIAVAEAETGGVAYEIDTSRGGWEVHVVVDGREREVRVDVIGSRVLADRDDGPVDPEAAAALAAATIGLTEALELAYGEVPGVLAEASLDHDDGDHIWEVSLGIDGREPEVYVAVTGGVVGVERD